MSEIQDKLSELLSRKTTPTLSLADIPGHASSLPPERSKRGLLALAVAVAFVALAAGSYIRFKSHATSAAAPASQAPVSVPLKTLNDQAVAEFKASPGSGANPFLELLKKHPNAATVQSNAGVSYLSAGQLSQAEPHLRLAVELEPNNARFRNNLAALLIKRGQFAEARVELERASELDPTYIDAYLNLGILGEKEKDWSKATEAYFFFVKRSDVSDPRRNLIMDRMRIVSLFARHKKEDPDGTLE